jgi:hypothetical protein
VAPGTKLSKRTIAIIVAAVVVVVAGVAGALVLTSGSDGDGESATTTIAPETTTTTARVPGPIAPLTGLEDPSGAVAGRCAVTVKIGNTADAHPQHGIGAADVVYEEVVDGGITRLVAIYNSQAPDQVGSVRSVRPTDQSIVWPIKGVFAYSGGNSYELASIADAPVTKLDETSAGSMMFRGPGRAPNNLFAHVDQMYDACQDPPPPPLFTYRPVGTPSAGAPISSVAVTFGRGYDTSWDWDAAAGRWQRSIFGAPDNDPDGNRLGMANVVVMEVAYPPDASRTTVEADMMGRGDVWVFTEGKVTQGYWERTDKEKPAQLYDGSGVPIGLTPGQTWVELLPAGNVVTTTP